MDDDEKEADEGCLIDPLSRGCDRIRYGRGKKVEADERSPPRISRTHFPASAKHFTSQPFLQLLANQKTQRLLLAQMLAPPLPSIISQEMQRINLAVVLLSPTGTSLGRRPDTNRLASSIRMITIQLVAVAQSIARPYTAWSSYDPTKSSNAREAAWIVFSSRSRAQIYEFLTADHELDRNTKPASC